EGTPVGGQADAHVYSLSPTKLVIAAEGGIVATNDDALAEQIRIGREYGMHEYDSRFAGLNSRLSEFSALLGRRSLELLEPGILRRQEVSDIFRREIGDLPGIDFQSVRPTDRCSYKDFSITVEESAFGLSRDQLRAAMEAENIDTRRYYTPPVHRHQAYRKFAPAEESLSNTNVLSQRSLSLPIWSRMDDDVVLGISRAVRRIHGSVGKVATALR
ncbi:MAG: DegT/DnrJ/EryC1/StrS family aminotransferase, partial [Planctomycetes bacterium]|nr:DegT/DnrJ/EryC1/StrS family aminotransferase [Planctomycetota bacterium]